MARLENGARCDDPRVNRLTVIANESFADFARKLQTELEDECGVKFEGRIMDKRQRHTAKLNKAVYLDPDFAALWERISHQTRYRVEFSTPDVVQKSARLLHEKPNVSEPMIGVTRTLLETPEDGIGGTTLAARTINLRDYRPPLPDVIGYLQRETELTRSTLAEILIAAERVEDVLINPQELMEYAASAIQLAKQELMVEGIKYERIAGQSYEMMRFDSPELKSYLDGYRDRMVEVKKSVYDVVAFDSEIERKFAEDLDTRTDIKLFVKLPGWFRVKTPLGDYNPDWAIVKNEPDGKVYLVRETKHTRDLDELSRRKEKMKVQCGEAHFADCLGQDFKVATNASEI